MIDSQAGHMVCPRLECHARIRRLWAIKDLPLTARFDYKRFTIDSELGYWEYVPHAHKGCVKRSPKPGTVVAKVRTARWAVAHPMHRAMTFRPCKPPRGE
jgi:hypothetical protein